MYGRRTQNTEHFRRLNNFDGLNVTSAVASYDPRGCDTQFELVRIPTSPFNPWYPITEEVRTSYYDRPDPWQAELKKELRMNGNVQMMNGLDAVPPRLVLPQNAQNPFRNGPSCDSFYKPPTQSGTLDINPSDVYPVGGSGNPAGSGSWNYKVVDYVGDVDTSGGGRPQTLMRSPPRIPSPASPPLPRNPFTQKMNTCFSCTGGADNDCNSCAMCNSKDCACDKYQYLYSPACGITRSYRDYTQRPTVPSSVIIAPI